MMIRATCSKLSRAGRNGANSGSIGGHHGATGSGEGRSTSTRRLSPYLGIRSRTAPQRSSARPYLARRSEPARTVLRRSRRRGKTCAIGSRHFADSGSLLSRPKHSKPPGRATEAPQRWRFRAGRDPSHRVAALAQVTISVVTPCSPGSGSTSGHGESGTHTLRG